MAAAEVFTRPMELSEHHPLQALNTFGLDVRARWFAEAHSQDDLSEALAFARDQDLRVLVLGGGSNLVLTRDLEGLVLRVALQGIEVGPERGDRIAVRVAAGEAWSPLVERCLGEGLHGLENLGGIPGTAGAAPVQNIGAYGVELRDRLIEVEALDRESGALCHFDRAACNFGYRQSVFKGALAERTVITAITLGLSRTAEACLSYEPLRRVLGACPSPAEVHAAVLRLRARLPDPAVLGNAGSFFTNPIVGAARCAELRRAHPDLVAFPHGDGFKVSAGWLIERLGLRGVCEGRAGVHRDHALVLVNLGGATGAEILALAARIQREVRAAFGVELEIEPRIVG